MKEADDYAINRLHIPSLQLMENAGKAVANEILQRRMLLRLKDRSNPTVVILCGKGNNGGDGFVVARILAERNIHVTVVLIESEKKLRGDAMENYQRLQSFVHSSIDIIRIEKFKKQKNRRFDIIIDAMLGTSFSGTLHGAYLSAVQWCNKQKSLKIAVDIPTGLNELTVETNNSVFHADVTVTFSQPKIGFYYGRAKEITGDVVVVDIGIPRKAVMKPGIFLVDSHDIRKNLPVRSSNSHKHSVGKIFILSGSKGMMGAAWLCSQSAMRSGAGQVIMGVPESEYPVIAKRTVEVMPLALPDTSKGSIALSAMNEIKKRIDWSTVVLVGCGMSQNIETQELMREVIRTSSKPVVADADGLNALAGQTDILEKRKSRHLVITPHHGEFSRLIGIPSQLIDRQKFSLASAFAERYNVVVVLKGAPTIIAEPGGKIYVNPTGNPGMSTAGSGDVLAGMIASFIGQGNSPLNAAMNAVFLHGKSGDIGASAVGMHSLIAGDLLRYLPDAFREVIVK